jgi:excisionase family DNA binding protein
MISSLEVVMARTFPQISNHARNLVPFPSTDFEPLLDSNEAAALLRIHPKTLKKMASRGEIQARRVRRFWRFRASDLNEWLWRQERDGYGSRTPGDNAQLGLSSK